MWPPQGSHGKAFPLENCSSTKSKHHENGHDLFFLKRPWVRKGVHGRGVPENGMSKRVGEAARKERQGKARKANEKTRKSRNG